MCLQKGKREQRRTKQANKLGSLAEPPHPPTPCPLFFYLCPGREFLRGAKGAEAKLGKKIQLHYPRPPSVKKQHFTLSIFRPHYSFLTFTFYIFLFRVHYYTVNHFGILNKPRKMGPICLRGLYLRFETTTCNVDTKILCEVYWSLMLSFQYINATLFYENT